MPEGPEVKIASSYYNSFFDGAKNITFELLTEYYEKKYADVFELYKAIPPKRFSSHIHHRKEHFFTPFQWTIF